MTTTILALDMSSTKIGACYDGRELETITLKGSDIAGRCAQAAAWIAGRVRGSDIDIVVIESPVGRFASALIPQCRVAGAVLAVLNYESVAWCEVSPAQAKKALTGKGVATKEQMIQAAQHSMTACGWVPRLPAINEHEADAYALWLAGKQLRVEVSE